MNIKEIPAKPKEQEKLRVAAYVRVSAEMEMKLHSLKTQESYYLEYIDTHPGWELVDIYSDYGISGTLVQRPAFQRMLEDCRAGKIDLVVTKSVTRFARNTVILLETIRELKALGIDCYFEKEDMHSISPDGELLLTLLAMYAEEEARSASENQIWRVRKRFEQGLPWVGNMLGYRLVNGKMVVVPEEAAIVRQIYGEYLSGMGVTAIANKMAQSGIETPYIKKWTYTGIWKILRNEAYAGNLLLQKTYRPDFRTKVSKVNHGKVRQYYVEGSHEPIVDKQIFDAVQCEIQRRKDIWQGGGRPSDEKSENIFTGMVVCGICGYHYGRKHQRCQNHLSYLWLCNKYSRQGKSVCPSQKIPENILIEKTKAVLESETLTHELLEKHLQSIVIPGPNHIIYVFKDGKSVDVPWEHQSRSMSWTPEKRQAARERALKQHGKERK